MYSNETYLLEQLQESGLLNDHDIKQVKGGQNRAKAPWWH